MHKIISSVIFLIIILSIAGCTLNPTPQERAANREKVINWIKGDSKKDSFLGSVKIGAVDGATELGLQSGGSNSGLAVAVGAVVGSVSGGFKYLINSNDDNTSK